MNAETVLDLLELGVAPGSGRGLTQTLSPIRSGSLRRLANGALVSRHRPSLRKYQTSINFSDSFPPAFGALWAGDIVTVHCVAELEQLADKALERPHVPGSVVWRDAEGVEIASGEDETVAPAGAVWVYYCPILVCRVESWDLERDEYGEIASGSLNLLEV